MESQELHMSCAPRIGMEFNSQEEAWEFYNQYARRYGFSVRISYRKHCKETGKFQSGKFCCAKEGFRKKDKRDFNTKKPRAETRTGCEAHMCISFNNDKTKFRVHSFDPNHNHDLVPPELVHMLVSHRKISKVKAPEISIPDNAGIRLKASHELMGKQVGGITVVGFTKVDQQEILRPKREKSLQYEEVSTIISYFRKQMNQNPSFVYDVQMDNEQVANIFWADAKMIFDYAHFGDVIIFDTTYRMDNVARPLGVFVGFNHYMEVVIFGATLLYDETIASFQWLFETFVKTMGGQKPKTFFTDQDQVMKKAISIVMPETHHALCTWHIWQNAIKHMSNYFNDDSGFPQKLRDCIFEIDNEEEFLMRWEAMLVKYPVEWLHGIFKVREKWAKPYMHHVFSLGIKSAQLSESLNGDMKHYLKPDLDINQFFTHFERVVDDKRYKEWEVEHNCLNKPPTLNSKRAPMVIQASEIYTSKIFERFQVEFDESLAALEKNRIEVPSGLEFVVAMYGEKKEENVQVILPAKDIICSCHKFETEGILCSHAIYVLDRLNEKVLPEKYILKRWTRKARNGSVQDAHGRLIVLDPKSRFMYRYRDLCPKMDELVNRASECHEAYEYALKLHADGMKTIEQILQRNSVGSE